MSDSFSLYSPDFPNDYCGRFAPSPSGHLNLGSLFTAYAAYWRSLEQHGTFLIRIEDLDFPRCPRPNIPLLCQELQLFGLHSDKKVRVQSEHLGEYHRSIQTLLSNDFAYFCTCTRAQSKEQPCTCWMSNKQARIRTKITLDPDTPHSCKVNITPYLESEELQSFTDANLGVVRQSDLEHSLNPYLTLERADGIIAYNLAVVIDDIEQEITEVVRGADMLDATFLQLPLYELDSVEPPVFCHIPLITDSSGRKLSKQNHAPAVFADYTPRTSTLLCLQLLQESVYHELLQQEDVVTLLQDLEQCEESLTALITDEVSTTLQKKLKAQLRKLAPKEKDEALALLTPTGLTNMLLLVATQAQQAEQAAQREDDYFLDEYDDDDDEWADEDDGASSSDSGRENWPQVYYEGIATGTYGPWSKLLALWSRALGEASWQQAQELTATYYALLTRLHTEVIGPHFQVHALPKKPIVL